MPFNGQSFENLIPSYLSSERKQRLVEGLSQFKSNLRSQICYNDFYTSTKNLLQSDIIESVKLINWTDTDNCKIGFSPGIIISSSCDINVDNPRTTNIKQALFAPIIELDEYVKNLKEDRFSEEQISEFVRVLKRQEHTNLFYLPANSKNGKEYIVFFDKITWRPISDIKQITESKYLSLSTFGYYLFLMKLSYNFCRLPEEFDERS